MGYKYITREDFSSLNQLMGTLARRENNKFMKHKNESRTNSESFSGTKSYEEAQRLLVDGYVEILGKLKDDVKNKIKVTSKTVSSVNHPMPHSAIVGYTPCVPNAILGLPNSMISVDRVPIKRKTLSILYSMGANCGMNTEFFESAGAALLSAINIIEKGGIQTELKLCFFPSEANDELLFPTVVIKKYGERFSLQKVSFPLAHTSMFRRIGFRWAETTPYMKTDFSFGYGRDPKGDMREILNLDSNTKFIDIHDINSRGNSVTEILKILEVI